MFDFGGRLSAMGAAGRFRLTIVALVAAGSWLLTLIALVKLAVIAPEVGWSGAIIGAAMGVSPIIAWTATRHLRAAWRWPSTLPASLLSQQWHGRLEVLVPTERRSLRPVGLTLAEAVSRTNRILDQLTPVANVRIFRGVYPPSGATPPLAHVVSSGRTILLVESVALPPGNYSVDAAGCVKCDGIAIGQSESALIDTARRWRNTLPRHRVTTFVVVHRAGNGRYTLPHASAGGVVWTLAEGAAEELRGRLRPREPISKDAFAALIERIEPALV